MKNNPSTKPGELPLHSSWLCSNPPFDVPTLPASFSIMKNKKTPLGRVVSPHNSRRDASKSGLTLQHLPNAEISILDGLTF